MHFLIIKHQGKVLQEIQLKKNTVYNVGRSRDNHIVLPEQAGISRKHLEIFLQDNEKLTVKNLSPISALIINEADIEEGEVEAGSVFQIQNYEFLFKKVEHTNIETQEENTTDEEEKDSEEEIEQEAEDFSIDKDVAPYTKGGVGFLNNDKTTIMSAEENNNKLSAYLKVSTDEKAPRDIFKLKDQPEWLIGRDESCDLVIDNANISRTHFKNH